MTLDEREKDDETNPISHNPFAINELWRSSGAAERLDQLNLTDRSTGIRGDIDLRAGGPEEQQQGNNELSSSEPTQQRSNASNEMTKQSQFLITPINPATYTTNPQRQGDRREIQRAV